MNFLSCAITAVNDMFWFLYMASWDPAHCSFATHHLSHTALSHTICHTQLSHTHTRSFTQNFVTYTIFFVAHHHFVTHNSSHTTCFTSRSSTTSFVFPSFPLPSTTFVAHYWKKLTCRVIRSFSFHNIWDNPSHWLIFFQRGRSTTNQTTYPQFSVINLQQTVTMFLKINPISAIPCRSHHYFPNNNPPEDVIFPVIPEIAGASFLFHASPNTL